MIDTLKKLKYTPKAKTQVLLFSVVFTMCFILEVRLP